MDLQGWTGSCQQLLRQTSLHSASQHTQHFAYQQITSNRFLVSLHIFPYRHVFRQSIDSHDKIPIFSSTTTRTCPETPSKPPRLPKVGERCVSLLRGRQNRLVSERQSRHDTRFSLLADAVPVREGQPLLGHEALEVLRCCMRPSPRETLLAGTWRQEV